MAQGDILLTATNIRGESKDTVITDSIELTGWSFSGTSPTDAATHAATGKMRMSQFVVTKRVDKSSVIFLQFLSQNRQIDSVKVHCRKAGGDKQINNYLIELSRAQVRSVVQKCVTEGATVLEETISFGYQTIQWSYGAQSGKGFLEGEVSHVHDVTTNDV